MTTAAMADVKVRDRFRSQEVRLYPRGDGGGVVRFDAPLAAVTPGQLAVFYQGDRVLGGGAIAVATGHSAPESAMRREAALAPTAS